MGQLSPCIGRRFVVFRRLRVWPPGYNKWVPASFWTTPDFISSYRYSTALGLLLPPMPSTTSSDGLSSSSSKSSRDTAPMVSPQLSHPYLSSGQASTIASWTSSLPNRSSGSRSLSDEDTAKREAAIEAYRQLKLAMFSKSGGASPSKPLSSS